MRGRPFPRLELLAPLRFPLSSLDSPNIWFLAWLEGANQSRFFPTTFILFST